MIYDCFFSYQHEDLNLVESIVLELEKRKISCWYAPRNVSGRYAKAIADGISHSKVFILLLNKRSIISEEVLNEVEMAHNIAKCGKYAFIQPVCTEILDFNTPEYQEMMYYIRRLQFLNIENINNYAEIADYIIQSKPELKKQSKQRIESCYVTQDIEDERLKVQNKLLERFDNDIYETVLNRYKKPIVLDVGCGTGDMLISKIKEKPLYKYIGIDKSKRLIEIAKRCYNAKEFCFIECDIDLESFKTILISEMEHNCIGKFDIINISMLLLHLSNPAKLLSILKDVLSNNGILVIRDIDDGLNFAFPDDDNSFERIYKICEHDEQSGNRRNGRQIYHDLIKAGFSRIKLERQGLTSIGMSKVEKEALFQMYFPFTLENAKIMMEKFPWNKEYQEDYLWYEREFESIHNQFLKHEFIFSLGFVTFTAQL